MSQDNGIEVLTPVGRLVGGDCFRGNDKDAEGRPLVTKSGPNTGQPRLDYYVGLAIAKTTQGVDQLIQQIIQVARAEFPQLFDASGNCMSPQFAFKVVDGDSQVPNRKGIKPCEREGYPGCWVFSWSSGFAPQCYRTGGAEQINNPEEIKKGYYIRIKGNIRGNGSPNQPGVFLNHRLIELVGYGPVISSGPDPVQVFGSSPASLPPGASATPLAGSTSPAGFPSSGGLQGLGSPGGAPGGLPGGPGGLGGAPGGPGSPGGAPGGPGGLGEAPGGPGGLGGAPGGPGGLGGAPGGPGGLGGAPGGLLPGSPGGLFPDSKYSYQGREYTVAQLHAAGWTDDQIKHLDEIPF